MNRFQNLDVSKFSKVDTRVFRALTFYKFSSIGGKTFKNETMFVYTASSSMVSKFMLSILGNIFAECFPELLLPAVSFL